LNGNGTYQLVFYTDNINILGVHVYSIKGNTEMFLVGVKVIGIEVIADKTTYIVRSRKENSGRSKNIKIKNNSYEGVKYFKYLEIFCHSKM
jgi:hypothetical protein